MTSLASGIMLLFILGFVQYSWLYEPINGVAIDFQSKWSYYIISTTLGVLVGYLITTGLHFS
ncbi:hypothetical protein [Pseudalkalibacillus hwajinpoensis]|uniref:Uncharacterized protein n=1 Tax=Guptibacillus hwajinpoensis TaxID=208199 RepID=A0A4U1ME69_9BACL|nr:hypothetical protein [Pseudalkalibacillus hwajinpoensis]TKD68655.1 hypothetical protein FBF83_15730 [Pseudalkalibacillus hwajinpoensis]